MGSDHMRLSKYNACNAFLGSHSFYMLHSSIYSAKHDTAEIFAKKTKLTMLYKVNIDGFQKTSSKINLTPGLEPEITQS